MKNHNIIINARKYDGSIHRSWKCRLIEQSEFLLTFVGEFENEVIHSELGVIRPGTISYEYYWLNRYYNIFRFHEPNGDLRNFYCNINLPPSFENGILDYIDLDIDVLVWKNYEYQILDLEEFEQNSVKYLYPSKIIHQAKKSLSEVIGLLEERLFPFDFVQ